MSLSTNPDDGSLSTLESLGGYDRYSNGVEVKRYKMAKVHSRPVQTTADIEIELARAQSVRKSSDNRQELSGIRSDKESRDVNSNGIGTINESSEENNPDVEPGPEVIVSNLEVDETLFESKHNFAMTRAPSKIPDTNKEASPPKNLSPMLPLSRKVTMNAAMSNLDESDNMKNSDASVASSKSGQKTKKSKQIKEEEDDSTPLVVPFIPSRSGSDLSEASVKEAPLVVPFIPSRSGSDLSETSVKEAKEKSDASSKKTEAPVTTKPPPIPKPVTNSTRVRSTTSRNSKRSATSRNSKKSSKEILHIPTTSDGSQNKGEHASKESKESVDSQELYAMAKTRSALSARSGKTTSTMGLSEGQDHGVVWVRSFNSKAGSVFFGKSRSPSLLSRESSTIKEGEEFKGQVDNDSLLSGDTQERYAKKRSPSFASKTHYVEPVDNRSIQSGDTQEIYAKSRSRSFMESGSPSTQDRKLAAAVDNSSLLSGDTQEKYAKKKSPSLIERKSSKITNRRELLSPTENTSLLSADSQELYALSAMNQHQPSMPANVQVRSSNIPPKDTPLELMGDHTLSKSNSVVSSALFDKAAASQSTKGQARPHSVISERSEQIDRPDTAFTEGTEESGHVNESESESGNESGSEVESEGESESDEDIDDEDLGDDDETVEEDYDELEISSINGRAQSVQTFMSDVSGSFDDDEILHKKLGTIGEDTELGPANLEEAKKIIAREEREKLNPKKTKKKVFKLATGLGRKSKVTKKTVKTESLVKNAKKVKTKKTMKKKITNMKPMKRTAIRSSNKKKDKKKAKTQLRTICFNGQFDQDDIVPRKSDPGAKVMRVCKLTSHGYVAAEFTSIDPNNTPLHIACLTHYPSRFILDHLLKQDVDMAIATENSSGELPIHYAVMDKKGVDPLVFDALIESFPESVEHKNIDDSLPIHVACQVGAPSLYTIKKLLEINPRFALAQNDLQVELDDDISEEEDSGGIFSNIGTMLCTDWFQKDDSHLVRFETGWTPLHLAVVNGAPPAVIETIIEANVECMNVMTNKNRTPLDCANGVIINAVLHDVPMYKVQNTFNAIEVMQSYDKEFRHKKELALKASIVNSSLENTDSYGDWWMNMALKMPEREKIEHLLKEKKTIEPDEDDAEDEEDWEFERGMTDLHRAVLKKVEPEEVQELLERSPECMDIVSTADRTPFECAKEIIIRGLLKGTTIKNLTNTFVTLEAMQAYRESQGEVPLENFNATAALSKADVKHFESDERKVFGSTADTYEYMKDFVEMNLNGQSLLGPLVKADNDSAVQPYEYYPPENLRHVNLRLNIPVGYRRMRRAFLSTRSEFLKFAVYSERLAYENTEVLPWNKCGRSIGKEKLGKNEKWSDFVGATKTLQYIFPGSDEIGDAHVAYETMELIEYNDFCFAVKSILKTPDLPFGSEYETHMQTIIIDKGINNCRMICSSEVVVTGMELDDDWQVRNAMRHRAAEFSFALGDAICMHAGNGEKRKE